MNIDSSSKHDVTVNGYCFNTGDPVLKITHEDCIVSYAKPRNTNLSHAMGVALIPNSYWSYKTSSEVPYVEFRFVFFDQGEWWYDVNDSPRELEDMVLLRSAIDLALLNHQTHSGE